MNYSERKFDGLNTHVIDAAQYTTGYGVTVTPTDGSPIAFLRDNEAYNFMSRLINTHPFYRDEFCTQIIRDFQEAAV